MLVLKRREGQWLHITHKSGDVLMVKVIRIFGDGYQGRLDLVFDDPIRNFEIQRPERKCYPKDVTVNHRFPTQDHDV